MPGSCWYAGGLRFECQGSSRCCRARKAEETFVFLDRNDRRRLARHLGLATLAFTRDYCDETEGLHHLRGPGQDCEFLQGGRCSVYEARPRQCRTWPFWRENMVERVWREEVTPFCAGVGQGRRYTREEIDRLVEDS